MEHVECITVKKKVALCFLSLLLASFLVVNPFAQAKKANAVALVDDAVAIAALAAAVTGVSIWATCQCNSEQDLVTATNSMMNSLAKFSSDCYDAVSSFIDGFVVSGVADLWSLGVENINDFAAFLSCYYSTNVLLPPSSASEQYFNHDRFTLKKSTTDFYQYLNDIYNSGVVTLSDGETYSVYDSSLLLIDDFLGNSYGVDGSTPYLVVRSYVGSAGSKEAQITLWLSNNPYALVSLNKFKYSNSDDYANNVVGALQANNEGFDCLFNCWWSNIDYGDLFDEQGVGFSITPDAYEDVQIFSYSGTIDYYADDSWDYVQNPQRVVVPIECSKTISKSYITEPSFVAGAPSKVVSAVSSGSIVSDSGSVSDSLASAGVENVYMPVDTSGNLDGDFGYYEDVTSDSALPPSVPSSDNWDSESITALFSWLQYISRQLSDLINAVGSGTASGSDLASFADDLAEIRSRLDDLWNLPLIDILRDLGQLLDNVPPETLGEIITSLPELIRNADDVLETFPAFVDAMQGLLETFPDLSPDFWDGFESFPELFDDLVGLVSAVATDVDTISQSWTAEDTQAFYDYFDSWEVWREGMSSTLGDSNASLNEILDQLINFRTVFDSTGDDALDIMNGINSILESDFTVLEQILEQVQELYDQFRSFVTDYAGTSGGISIDDLGILLNDFANEQYELHKPYLTSDVALAELVTVTNETIADTGIALLTAGYATSVDVQTQTQALIEALDVASSETAIAIQDAATDGAQAIVDTIVNAIEGILPTPDGYPDDYEFNILDVLEQLGKFKVVFPLTIPFDLADVIGVMDGAAEAPKFEIPTGLGSVVAGNMYTVDSSGDIHSNSPEYDDDTFIDVDASSYGLNDIMKNVRVVELIVFVVGLILVTRTLVRG